jgi:DNA helicase-2/ATP-dependent DNA helicase PcrA
MEDLLTVLSELHGAVDQPRPVDVLDLVLEKTHYAIWLASQRDGPSRLQHVEHLRGLLEHSGAPDLATWLADMHLGDVEEAADSHSVALLTVHAAKGREWPVVFVTGVEEGLLPHVRKPAAGEPEPADDEERRLTYVALSRCQVLLYLTYCRTRRPPVDGPAPVPEPRVPSRYLRGLPTDLITRVA